MCYSILFWDQGEEERALSITTQCTHTKVLSLYIEARRALNISLVNHVSVLS